VREEMKLQNTNINIRVTKKMREQLVEISKERGVSYSSVLRKMIKEYIAKNGEIDLLDGDE
jgi:antitoxin component of RelBE/YafQ-DinJ toxin-antitoxin module